MIGNLRFREQVGKGENQNGEQGDEAGDVHQSPLGSGFEEFARSHTLRRKENANEIGIDIGANPADEPGENPQQEGESKPEDEGQLPVWFFLRRILRSDVDEIGQNGNQESPPPFRLLLVQMDEILTYEYSVC